MITFSAMQSKIQSQTSLIVEFESKIETIEAEMKKINDLFSDTQSELERRCEELHTTKTNLKTTVETLQSTQVELKKTTIERDERDFLIDAHVKQESVLHQKASELLDVVNDSVMDVSGLHEKLERKTGIEDHNKAAMSTFKGSFSEMIANMEANIATLQRNCTEYFEKLPQNVG